MEELDIAYA